MIKIIVRAGKNYETNSLFPNENWYPNQPDNMVVNELTQEGRSLSKRIIASFPFYDMVIEDGELVDIVEWEPLQYTITETTITVNQFTTITTSQNAVAVVDEEEYLLDDGILEYQNENVGLYTIELKKDGFKSAFVDIEVIPGG